MVLLPPFSVFVLVINCYLTNYTETFARNFVSQKFRAAQPDGFSLRLAFSPRTVGLKLEDLLSRWFTHIAGKL